MNKMRRFLLQALGIKLGVVFLGVTIIGTRYVLGRVLWFVPQASTADIKNAIERAQDVDVRNEFGLTGLMYAAGNAKYETARLLIQRGADLDLTSHNEDGNTALHIACFNGAFPGSYKIAKLLIEKGADPNIPNKQGQRPIHYILEIGDLYKRLELMKMLKNAGADINVQNYEGNTMLHLSVNLRDKKWIEVARKTFGSAIRTDIKNYNNETPLQLAKKLGFTGEDSVAAAITDDPSTFQDLRAF